MTSKTPLHDQVKNGKRLLLRYHLFQKFGVGTGIRPIDIRNLGHFLERHGRLQLVIEQRHGFNRHTLGGYLAAEGRIAKEVCEAALEESATRGVPLGDEPAVERESYVYLLEAAAAGVTLGEDYPYPMIDHAEAREITLRRFEAAKA